MVTFSIGQAAQMAGVPVSTVRFYERIGLVKPDFRTGGNYRAYLAASVDRLKFIRTAQATGLSLEDIESLLELTHTTKPPCEEVLSLMRGRLKDIRARIEDLNRIEKVLAKSLRSCCKGNPRDICSEVCRLGGSDPTACKPPKRKYRQSA